MTIKKIADKWERIKHMQPSHPEEDPIDCETLALNYAATNFDTLLVEIDRLEQERKKAIDKLRTLLLDYNIGYLPCGHPEQTVKKAQSRLNSEFAELPDFLIPIFTRERNSSPPVNKETDMKDMSTKEILAEYNKLTGKGIIKFTGRKIAARRLKNARILHANGKAIAVKKPKPINKAQHTRHRVTVQKGRAKPKEYRSVKQAFEELGLSAHVKFRMELKAKGSHEIQGYKFKLVK